MHQRAFTPVDDIADARKKKKGRQAFYTPLDLVERIVNEAPTYDGCRVLEPSAGDGRFIHSLLEAGCTVNFCETDPDMRARCEAMGARCIGEDFLSVTPVDEYQIVVMNPPFTKRQDRKHIEHAWKFVRQHGELHAICSASMEAPVLSCELRMPGCNYLTVEALPKETFKTAGVSVATLLIRAVRCPDMECCGFRNLATANAYQTMISTQGMEPGDDLKNEIYKTGGSVYGIDWGEIGEAWGHEVMESTLESPDPNFDAIIEEIVKMNPVNKQKQLFNL